MDDNTKYPSNYYNPVDLRNLLRLLASQNTMWTRSYVVSYISNIDDLPVLENRLYVNVMDFTKLFNIYYGDESSDIFDGLFRAYVRELINTLKLLVENFTGQTINTQQALIKAREDWNNAGNELALFLSSINPYWEYTQFQRLISDHIEMTIDQIDQRLIKNYDYEIHQYDFIEYHSLMIADILVNGIIDMFY